jgi:proteasome accessory factor B
VAINKVERLMNLVICLLATRQYLSAEQIRASVAGYQDSKSDEAFNRMFERDKTELRDLGIPLETGRSSGFSPVDGYRINRDAYELPDIDLDTDEAAAVALAAALWDSPELAATSNSALMKLRAAGVQMDSEAGFDAGATAIHSSAPRGIGSPEVLGTLLAALDESRPVHFEHRSSRTSPYVTRTVEPWGVVTHQGRWYLVGHDRDREQTRTFRLTRITSVTPFGKAGEVTRPADADLRAIVGAAVDRLGPPTAARVWVAAGRAAGLRRMARGDEPADLEGRHGSILEIEMRSVDGLTRQVLGAGTDAVVIGPPELRNTVVDGLKNLAGVSL